MKQGDKVTIIPSSEICEMRMCGLCSREGTVTGIVYCKEGIKGCWVRLDGELFKGEQEWYIPFSSIIE
jgi:hypothetical protein